VKKRCAFCETDAVEKGGEHIWDDWLNKALPGKTLYRARKRYTLNSPLIQYDTTNLGEQLPVVCETCNSGWMSALTLKIKTAFSQAMLEGEPFSLGARDAALLAAFTFMKAVITNHVTEDHEPFFTRAARERLRTDLAVPPLTKIWFAAYHGESLMSTKSNFSVVGQSTPGPLYGIEFASFTYVVGKLALQLLTPRWKHINHRGRPLLSLIPNVHWEQAAVLFWPHTGSFVPWPPPKYIRDDMIQAFIQRLGNPVNVPVTLPLL
jgi:hypothetical protein